MEISTAAREGLPVKFFVLDDQAYHYMQVLQKPAYLRTTATILARLDYARWRRAGASPTRRSRATTSSSRSCAASSSTTGPVLVRVAVDYRGRQIRWIEAVRQKYTRELTAAQKMRFLARIGTRAWTRCRRAIDRPLAAERHRR